MYKMTRYEKCGNSNTNLFLKHYKKKIIKCDLNQFESLK